MMSEPSGKIREEGKRKEHPGKGTREEVGDETKKLPKRSE